MQSIIFTTAMAGVASNGIPWAASENEILLVDDALAKDLVELGRALLHDPLGNNAKPKSKPKAKDAIGE